MSRKRTAPVRPDKAAGAIIKELEPLTYGRSASQVFDDWLSVTEASLVMLPHHARSVAAGEGMAQDTDEVKALWERLRQVYDKAGWERLSRAFAHLLDSTATRVGELCYEDVVGEVFMTFGQPSDWSGQFFTPMPVAQMMIQMTLDPQEVERIVNERLREAILSAPDGELVYLSWLMARARNDGGIAAYTYFAEHLYPLLAGQFRTYTISDPCCGSGVMLVAAMSVLPAWLVQFGLVEFHAADIDPRCVKMVHINLMLQGAGSFVVRHQNTLSLEPDFTPPRRGRVQWLPAPVRLPGKLSAEVAVPEPALAPSTLPHPAELPRPLPPPETIPDVVLDIAKLTQLTLDL
jgi:hypothetical protein